jgi:ribosomal 30S subunit maturation factor RimM
MQRTATRCVTIFSHDQDTSTSIGARFSVAVADLVLVRFMNARFIASNLKEAEEELRGLITWQLPQDLPMIGDDDYYDLPEYHPKT